MGASKKIRVELVRSTIGVPERYRRVVESLGLKKVHSIVEHEATPGVLGMVKKVIHLLRVEEISG